MACEFVDNVDKSISTYRDIIKFIRKADLKQKQVKRVLVDEAGLSASQCSQIYKVATSPKDVFDRYINQTLGFNAALQEARKREPLTDAQRNQKLRNSFLALGHKFTKPFVAVEDTDFLLVIPGAIKDKEQFREETMVVGNYSVTVRKAEK